MRIGADDPEIGAAMASIYDDEGEGLEALELESDRIYVAPFPGVGHLLGYFFARLVVVSVVLELALAACLLGAAAVHGFWLLDVWLWRLL